MKAKTPKTGDPRIAEIRATLAQLRSGNWEARALPSGNDDDLDQIIGEINQLAEMLAARRIAETTTEQHFEELVDVIGAMAALDFSKRAPVGDTGSALDALGYGINMLSEELATSMVSKTYVDNILESMNDALVVVDRDLIITTANRAAVLLFGYPKDGLIGQPGGLLFEQEEIARRMAISIAQGKSVKSWTTTCRTRGGQSVPVSLSASAMLDPSDSLQGIVCILQDITERKQAEEALRQSIAQEETIRLQREMLAELSTPLIPINESVMVMPLIGAMDSRRAQQVIETLLHGIAGTHADTVILDITGVPIVDTQVANALVYAAQAVRLLGAQVILTGIRPEVAQTLVGMGADLRSIITHATLQSGIAATLRR